MWAVSFVSKNAREALERLKAAEQQREIKEAEQLTAKAMKILETRKQAQEAGLKAIGEERKRLRSRRQSLENKKRAQEAELEKQNKQKQEQEKREAYRRQYGRDSDPPNPPTRTRGRGRSR